LLVFAYCFTAWSDNDHFAASVASLADMFYSAVTQDVKAADILTKENL
jgi:hypothetical protein